MNNKYTNPPEMSITTDKTYFAVLETSRGTIRIRLFAGEAPVTVNNFVFLAREGFYNGTVFHRIMKGFMIQGGDPEGTGGGGPGYTFADEKITRDYTRGTIAMANRGPDTNGSQFFLMHQNNDLPKQYVIFGAIEPGDSSSLATLDAIAGTPVRPSTSGEQSAPAESVDLMQVTIEER
ncbi:peptidylprolyl isomerase [Candidatus Gottesmanbacteria bacterium RBG_16_52_11]|uniref:Peptidyl-prolyl cis-trans isomerase n=1 Tax=Candidatus Gottesmanbacteria bacterium RBG_16_52_11 TaxID=1798374 RepID=A0A1F5YW35_9BACT|nr:MAG: peptidylprolyl isomerase [Candidatus Gottesmanbacteria bacterium RBG_16_52_11]